ncbi:hypothetical protein CSE6_034_46930 [Comamonas sp. E6]|nr:hypothetical protein CSE6_034_46930 [Comamonas sp. E6]
MLNITDHLRIAIFPLSAPALRILRHALQVTRELADVCQTPRDTGAPNGSSEVTTKCLNEKPRRDSNRSSK